MAVKDFAMIKWLCQKFSDCVTEQDAITKRLEFFYDNDREILGDKGHRIEWSGYTLSNAIGTLPSAILKSDMVMADWLVNQEPDHATEDCYLMFKLQDDLTSGRLDIFKWLREEGGKIEDGTMVVAAGRGHLKFIQWLGNPVLTNRLFRDHSPLSGISSEAKFSIHTAAINGHLEVAKYLCEEAKKSRSVVQVKM
ncbi:LOW QUALITY PROTEIN: hypothetical protein PHMEG_00031949 [Phytophthora megakarya]|uniref:Uncharacterized protein n=1 Tax=Phytophthora megakarya TaxID=4795 RepID=A0A225UWY6_9STRA|nr:LOW QUALITY PROTEIN: hypothetical protein PHMEG_00031949 [Phytophthora megakarya]